MQAGVGHQAAGAPHLVAEAAEALVGVAVDAHFLAQELGIEAPALGEGGHVGAATVVGLIRRLLLQGDLQVVAGDGLVNRQGRKLIEGALVQLGRVDDIAASHAVLHRAGVVAAGGVGLLDLTRDGAHAVGQAGQGPEQGGQTVVGALGDLGRLFQQLFAAGRIELRIGSQEVEEAGEVAGPAGGAHFVLHPGADAGDLCLTDLMHLIRGQVGGRVAANEEGVEVLAALTMDQARLGRGLGQVVVAQHGQPGLTAGGDGAVDQGLGAGAQGGLIRRRDIGGQGDEGLHQHVAVGVGGQVALGLTQGAFDHGAGLQQASRQAASGIGDPGVVEGGRGFQSGDPGVGVGAAGDAGRTGEVGQGLAGAALGIKGQARRVQGDALQLAVDQVTAEGVVQAAVGVEGRRVDGVQAGLEGLKRLTARQIAGTAGIRQARQSFAIAVHA